MAPAEVRASVALGSAACAGGSMSISVSAIVRVECAVGGGRFVCVVAGGRYAVGVWFGGGVAARWAEVRARFGGA